jgi:uncharacterized membrane protein
MKKSIPKISVVLLLTSISIFCLSNVASAHAGHKKKEQTQTSPAAQTSVGTTTMQSVEESREAEAKSPAEPMRSKEEIMRQAMPEHMHNKIVHFPFALGLTGAFFLLLSFKWPQYRSGARLLLLIAAAAAIAAYFTGRAQEEPFEKGEMEPFLEAHKNSGIASAITLWVGVILTTWVQNRTLLIIYAIILLFLLSATGFFGGILAHG